MPDFSALYNPEQSNAPVNPDPHLAPIESPDTGNAGSDNTSFVNNQLNDLQNQFSKPSVSSMLEPVTYDPDKTNRDRYTKSDYFGELGFNPFSDNEDIYGNRQTNWNKLKNAFGGAWQLAKNQFADQVTSWGDTLSFFKDPTLKSAFQQAEMDRINKEQEDFNNNYPLFETQADRNSIWNFNTIANTIQQSGFAVGAIAEIAAEEAALSALTSVTFGGLSELQGARSAQLAMKIGDVVQKTQELSKAVDETNTMRKIFTGIGKVLPAGNLIDFGLHAKALNRIDQVAMGSQSLGLFSTISRGFGAAYRDLREFNAAIAQAKAGAASSYQDLTKSLVQKYQDSHNGADPDQLTLESMKNQGMEAAHITGAANTAVLLLTNKLAFGNIFKGFKPASVLAREGAMDGIYMLSEKEAAEKGGNQLVDAAGLNVWQRFRQQMLSSPWAALKYTEHNLGEAIKMNTLDVTQDAVQTYYKAKYDKDNMSWTDAIRKAAGDEWSVGGAKTFLSTFFTGAILGMGEKAFEHAPDIKNFVFDRSQYNKDSQDRKTEKGSVISTVNSFLKDPLNPGVNRAGDVPLQANFAALLKQAAASGDRKTFNDIKDDATREFILAGMKTGTLDAISDRLKDYTRNLTPEEFTKSFGMDYTKVNHDNIMKQVDLFNGRVKDIKTTYDQLSSRFPNPFNPFRYKKGTDEYNSEAVRYTAYQNAMDNMVFMKDSYKRGIERQNDVLNSVRDIPGIKDVGFQPLYTLTSRTELQNELGILKLEKEASDDVRTKQLKEKQIESLTAYHKDLSGYLDGYDHLIKNTTGAEQADRIKSHDEEYSQKFSKHLEGLLNGELVANGKDKMLQDDVDHATGQMMDYYKLQHEGKIMLDHVNFIADPREFEGYLNRHVEAAKTAFSELKSKANPQASYEGRVFDVDGAKYHVLKQHEDGSLSIQKEEADGKFTRGKLSKELVDKWVSEGKFKEVVKPQPKSVTVRGRDKDMTFTEGDTFVGMMSEEPGVYKQQNPSVYRNDKIKIHSISGDGKNAVVTVNNDEGHPVPLSYLANMAASDKWVNYKNLTPVQKTYLDLRNKAIQYRVIRKDEKGRTVYKPKDGKPYTQVVTGRIKLNEEKNGLKFVYLDPATQKEKVVDFNPKWAQNMQSILSSSEHARQAMESEKERRKVNFQKQREYLSGIISGIETNIDKLRQQKETNEEQHQKVVSDLGELRDHLKMVEEELSGLGRKGSRDYKNELKSLRETLPLKIQETEKHLEGLKSERDGLVNQLDALNKSRDLFYEGLNELDTTHKAFDFSGSDNEYEDKFNQLGELDNEQLLPDHSPEDVNQLIREAKREVDDLNGKIDYIQSAASALKKTLSRIIAHEDVFKVLADAVTGTRKSAQEIQTALYRLKLAEEGKAKDVTLFNTGDDMGYTYNNENQEKLDLINQLLTGLNRQNKGSELNKEALGAIDLAKQLKSLNTVLDKVTKARDEAAASEARYREAADQKTKISGLEDRLKFLEAIKKGLTDEHVKATTERRKQEARKAEEARQFHTLTGLADQGISQDKKTFEHEGHSKPIFDETALFKTTGKHYADDADTKLNEENNNHRFFRFSEAADTQNLYLMPVTAANDEHGIRREDAYKDDIKLIAVRKNGDKFSPVGIDGKELAFPNKENIIYSSMHGNDILLGSDKAAAVKYVRDNFVTGKLNDDQIWANIQDYKATRQQIRDAVAKKQPIYLDVTGKSSGIQAMLPKDSVTGLPQELNTEGRLVAKGTKDWKNIKHPNGQDIKLMVSTPHTQKEDTKNVLPGRLVMVRTDNGGNKTIFRVFNRQMNEAEKNNFINILKEYSKLFGAENLTEDQKKTLGDIRNYLKNVVFWSLPKAPGTANRDLANDQFWISNGFVHRTKTASSVPFNETDIEKNREDLTKDLYHAVNNFTLKGGKPYNEVTWKDGKLESREWQNYAQYLLAPRENGAAPVYTNVPSYESPESSNNPQVKSVYLKYSVPAEYNKANAGTPPGKNEAPPTGNPVQKPAGAKFVNNNKDLLNLPKDKDVVYTVKKKSDGKEAFITTKWDAANNIWEVSGITDTDGTDLTSKAKAFYEKDINETLKDLRDLEGRPDNAFDEVANEFRRTYYNIGDAGTIKTDDTSKETKQVAETLATGEATKTAASVQPEVKPATSPETKTPTEVNEALLNKIFSKSYQASMPEVSDEQQYRLPISEVTNKEDFKKVEDWFTRNLPQIPLNKAAYLINGRAWGQFVNGAVHIYENAGTGTGLHEAFEAVWSSYLNDKEQQNLIDDFRNREGAFTDPFTGITKAYTDANARDVRENLAEEFMKHVQSEEENTPAPKTFGDKIIDFFKNLWKTIRSYIGLGREKQEELDGHINTIFKRINSGYFAHEAPIRDYNNGIGEYRLADIGVSEEVKKYAMEGLTSTFFSKLFYGKNNIDSLIGDEDNAALTQKLMNDTFNTFYNSLGAPLRNIELSAEKELGRSMSDKEKMAILERYKAENPLFTQTINLFDREKELKEGLQTYLGRFGLEFNPVPVDDKIQAQLEKEETATNPLGIIDAISIDPRKLTSANVNMLIASLTDDEYRKGLRLPKTSPLGLPQLVDFNKVKVTLLNELSGCVPVIRDGKRVNNIDLMFERLDNKYKLDDGTYKPGFLWIPKLKTRLRLQELNGDPVPPDKLSADDVRMLVGFEKSFTSNLMQPDKLIVGPDNYMYITNPVVDTNQKRVRTEWENNLKARVNPNKVDPNLLVYANTSTGELTINRDSEQFKRLIKDEGEYRNGWGKGEFPLMLEKLSWLGVTFNEDPKTLFYSKKGYKGIIGSSYAAIVTAIKNGDVNTIPDLYGKQVVNSRINALQKIQAELTPEDMVLSHLNAEGKSQYSVTIPSNISHILNSLVAVDNQADFIRNNPQLGEVDGHGNVTLNPYQSRSLLLGCGGMVFDEEGNKKSDIDYRLISGMALSEDIFGKNTSDLVYPDRVTNEINSLLNNTHFTIINSDKGNEFGLGFDQPFLSFNDTKLIRNNDKILDVYFDQLADEMDAAYHELANPSGIQYYSDNKTGALKLGHYREILGPDLLSKFVKDVLGAKAEFNKDKTDFTIGRPDNVINQDAYEKRRDTFLNNTQASAIKDRIEKYLEGYTKDTIQKLVNLDIFQRFPVESNGKVTGYRYSTSALSGELLNRVFGENIDPKNIHEHDMSFLARYLAINKEIGVTEQHKLIFGHPAMYKDLAKRSNGANSNKEAIVDNTTVLNWLDKNMPREDGKVRSNDLHQTFNHVTYADVNAASIYYKQMAEEFFTSMRADRAGAKDREAIERVIGARFDGNGKLDRLILKNGKPTGLMKPYLAMDEGDGQGNIMPDFYRDMLYLSGKWSKEQEAQWQYEMAYETVARSQKSRRDTGYKEYSPEKLKAARDTFLKGNPGAILQPLKPQYFGYADDSMQHTTFLKHSVQPKFYRFVEGTQYEPKYIQHQENQVDVMDFGSGQKVGAIYDKDGRLTPMYNDEGKANRDLPPIQKLFTKYYGIQVEVPNAFKDEVVRGTQVTKLLVSNYIVNGKGINPEAEGMVRNYMDTISKLVDMGKKGLVKELGLKTDDDGNYYTHDVTKLVNLLRNEAVTRGLPDNMVDAINSIKTAEGNTVLQYKFDSLSNREKIEQILSSIIDSRVISEKMNGMPAVQVASSLYEKDPRNFMYLKDGRYEQLSPESLDSLSDEERKSIKMTSNDLKFYRLENGRIAAMEVYLPWHFEGISPKELGLTRGKGDIWLADPNKMDKRLLEAIGFRIPTQGMNSIDSLIIKGFMDSTGGNQVVVPSEMVGKSGSDFDIDKLNIYLPNYYLERKDYGTKQFRDFMVSDMVNRGANEETANRLMDAYKENDLRLINQSTYTSYGKEEKGAKWSLEDLTDGKNEFDQAAFVKKSLSNYNRQFSDGNKLTYVDHEGDSKAAMQNRLIRQMKDLIENRDNYRQLLMPNSTDTLKALANEIRDLKGLPDEEASLTRLRQLMPMAETRERYLTGKKLVGIAALQITLHAMAQVAGLELTGKFDGKSLHYLYANNYKALLESLQTGHLSYQELREKVRQMDINIRLNHNTNENGKLYLYAKTDQAGNWISELHSEAISGFVDAAKDPFIFDLNLNLDTASTWFYLQKLGVPVREIAYLHTQPIIEDYFNELAKNKSIVKQANDDKLSNRDLLFKVASNYYKIPNDNFYDKVTRLLKQAIEAKEQGRRAVAKALFNDRKELINQFLADVNGYRNKAGDVSADQLKAAIGKKGELTHDENMAQLGNLFDYLEYKQQASQLSDFVKGITYDTTSTRTIADNRLQEARWNKTVSQNFIRNPDSILKNTFIGAMKEQKEDVYNLLRDFFTSLHPKALPAFDKVIDRINNFDLFSSKESQVNFMNRYQNFFLTYLLHTIPFKSEGLQTTLNNRYNLLFGDQSMAHQLVRLKDSTDPAVKNNPVIKELIGLFSNNARETSNISLFRRNLDSYDTNVMVEGIMNLWNHAKATADTKLQKFAEDLSVLSLVQSGLQNSRISIGRILPNELYSRMVGNILDNFTNGESQISSNLVYKQFHQNNYWNKDIVPVVKSEYIKFKRAEGNVIGLDSTSDTAQNDYLLRYAFKPGINKEAFDKLKREGRGFEGLDSLLYEKVNIKDSNNSDITHDGDIVYYRRVNKLGNRQYFTEAYSHDNAKSLIQANQYFDERGIKDVVDNLVSNAKAGNNTFDNFDGPPADAVTQALETLDAGCGKK